jgi:hypothetical protein
LRNGVLHNIIMCWQFYQSTGQIFDPNGKLLGQGYSGFGIGKNNPNFQFASHGPIPRGNYIIGDPHQPDFHFGILALPLYPYSNNDMEDRFGFFIQKDNEDSTISNGSIVLRYDFRLIVRESIDKILVVLGPPGKF